MRPEILAVLHDIEEAGTAILELSAQHTYEEYETQRWLRSSIEREFIIIGEAINAAFDLDSDLPITRVPQIVGFRNILVHRYRSVESDQVWAFIQRDLPRLLAEVRALLPPS